MYFIRFIIIRISHKLSSVLSSSENESVQTGLISIEQLHMVFL